METNLTTSKISHKTLSYEEALEISIEAYIYAFPMVIMELTRRKMTNVESPLANGHAPMNQFGHLPKFPDATFTEIVRPNADTLYSILWFDVEKEPLIITVPDSNNRYFLLPILDFWTDVFASPGSRTTGNQEQTFAIVGPEWEGTLPNDISLIRCPTSIGWLLGRTQTNGPKDFGNVNQFQKGLTSTPLSQWGKPFNWSKSTVKNEWLTKTPPLKAVEQMNMADFFSLFCELAKRNPSHANDYPILDRIQTIGIVPGQKLDFKSLPNDVQQALNDAGPEALKHIKEFILKGGNLVNGWRLNRTIGTYGTDYLQRATIAFAGLGANTIEDAIYPAALSNVDGTPFKSENKYILHFEKEELPPVRAFWSLTLYNDNMFFADNSINRYAIGDRDNLKFNDDGSLILYIQQESPGKDKESNWLPAPREGGFSLNLRLYWPKAEVLDGTWQPPAVLTIH